MDQREFVRRCRGSMTELLEAYQKWPDKMRFVGSYTDFLNDRGEAELLNHIPIVSGKVIDMYALYAAVTSRGGLEITCRVLRKMIEVSRAMGSNEDDLEAPCLWRKCYEHFLLAFEQQAMYNIYVPPDIQFLRILNGQSWSKIEATAGLDRDSRRRAIDKLLKPEYFDGDGKKGSFQGIISSLKSSIPANNIRAVSVLVRLSSLQESAVSEDKKISTSLGKRELPRFDFSSCPEVLHVLVQPPYLSKLCRTVIAFDESASKASGSFVSTPTLNKTSVSQLLTIQILSLIRNFTYDAQSQPAVAQHPLFLRILIRLLWVRRSSLVLDVALGVLANIAHHIDLDAKSIELDSGRNDVVKTPFAAILPMNGLVPSDVRGDQSRYCSENTDVVPRLGETASLQDCLDTLVPRLVALLHDRRRTYVLRASISLANLARRRNNGELVCAHITAKTACRLVHLLEVSLGPSDSKTTDTFANRHRRGESAQLHLDTHIDVEIRDAALQCIYYLVDHSERLRALFCAQHLCLRRVLLVCREETYDGQSAATASALLACLSTMPDAVEAHFNKEAEDRIVEIAASDDGPISRTMTLVALDCFGDSNAQHLNGASAE